MSTSSARVVRVVGVVVVAAVTGAVAGEPSQATSTASDGHELASAEPVLGARGLWGIYGKGWGKARPVKIYNGGVPSGLVYAITWQRWGKPRALGSGLTWLYKPGGGYYKQAGTILLRAYRLGGCGQGQPAYTRLEARWSKRPTGPVTGKWRPWNPGNICG